jgi:uncharacterized cupin superfamily protein
MALHQVHIDAVIPFAYGYGAKLRTKMTDIGRSVGSKTVGLTIQTMVPGCRSSRRHRHVFQEEILIVVSGSGVLLHDEEVIRTTPGDCFCYTPEDPHLRECRHRRPRHLRVRQPVSPRGLRLPR